MKCLKIDIKTGKKTTIDVDQKTLDSIVLIKKQTETQKTTMASLKSSAKTKLINLGFTEDECKHIIH